VVQNLYSLHTGSEGAVRGLSLYIPQGEKSAVLLWKGGVSVKHALQRSNHIQGSFDKRRHADGNNPLIEGKLKLLLKNPV